MGSKRTGSLSKARFRNLYQYKDLTDDEFEQMWETKLTGVDSVAEFESRIQRKIDSFGKDYDLDDLKANDILTLRALAQAYITLEDLENYSYKKRYEGIDDDQIMGMEKINNMMSSLRKDISSMQNDLKITRKIRKGDKEESVINYIEDLKLKAKRFYQARMSYIVCPECKMLLATIWTLYPESKNRITLTCNRTIPPINDGDKPTRCGHVFTVSTKELLEKGNANLIDVLPETIS